MPDPAHQITFDCADPDRMARFWREALHYDLERPPAPYETWGAYWRSLGIHADKMGNGYDSIVDAIGIRPRIWFQQVPEAKSRKNRLHFDLLVGGGRKVPIAERIRHVEAEVERLTGLGATLRTVMDKSAQGHFAIGMSDPEGNEVDIV